MKWRAKWSHVVIVLGLIAALAIASPAFGISKSIKKAIKREVAKQIGKATGPAGANGTNGDQRSERNGPRLRARPAAGCRALQPGRRIGMPFRPRQGGGDRNPHGERGLLRDRARDQPRRHSGCGQR